MSLFEKKPQISRSRLREILRKADGKGKLNRQKRVRLEQEVFGKKYGELISPRDYKRALNELKKARFRTTKSYRGKLELNRKIKFLEGLEKK